MSGDEGYLLARRGLVPAAQPAAAARAAWLPAAVRTRVATLVPRAALPELPMQPWAPPGMTDEEHGTVHESLLPQRAGGVAAAEAAPAAIAAPPMSDARPLPADAVPAATGGLRDSGTDAAEASAVAAAAAVATGPQPIRDAALHPAFVEPVSGLVVPPPGVTAAPALPPLTAAAGAGPAPAPAITLPSATPPAAEVQRRAEVRERALAAFAHRQETPDSPPRDPAPPPTVHPEVGAPVPAALLAAAPSQAPAPLASAPPARSAVPPERALWPLPAAAGPALPAVAAQPAQLDLSALLGPAAAPGRTVHIDRLEVTAAAAPALPPAPPPPTRTLSAPAARAAAPAAPRAFRNPWAGYHSRRD